MRGDKGAENQSSLPTRLGRGVTPGRLPGGGDVTRSNWTNVPLDPSSVSSWSGPSKEYHGNERHFDILAIQIKALSVSISVSRLTHQLCGYRQVT